MLNKTVSEWQGTIFYCINQANNCRARAVSEDQNVNFKDKICTNRTKIINIHRFYITRLNLTARGQGPGLSLLPCFFMNSAFSIYHFSFFSYIYFIEIIQNNLAPT